LAEDGEGEAEKTKGVVGKRDDNDEEGGEGEGKEG
jgi:hypothetical protein